MNEIIKSDKTLKDYLLLALIIIGVVALGLFSINQFTSWKHKNIFLQTPCVLCEELNPHLKDCFVDVSTIYTDAEGEVIENITQWKEENTKYYNTRFANLNITIIP